jgi:hypothetical protein
VSLPGIFGLAFVLLFFGLIIIFAAAGRTRPSRYLREITAFNRLKRAVGLSVEAGTRLHLSIGRGDVTSPHSAVAFVGLSLLNRIARATSISDRPPVSTAGEGALAVLSQDTLRQVSRVIGAEYDPNAGRLTGITPLSYAVGAMSVVQDEDVGANVLIGNFGSEVALINEAGERTGSLTLAGTDDIPGQAVLFATAQEPLIGEEVYAGGAYLGAGPMHTASLRAQDLLRWAIIVIIFIGAAAKLAGVL